MPTDSRERPAEIAAIELGFALEDAAPQIRTITSVLVDLEAACAFAGGSRAGKRPAPLQRVPAGRTPKKQRPRTQDDAWREAHLHLLRLRSTHLRVSELRHGSLHVLLELPWGVYATGGAALITAIGAMFGAPHRAAAAVQQARLEYWTKRLEADAAKGRYIAWRRAQNSNNGVQLETIDAPSLPAEHE